MPHAARARPDERGAWRYRVEEGFPRRRVRAVMRDLEDVDVDVRRVVVDEGLLRSNRRRHVWLAGAIGGVTGQQETPATEVQPARRWS